MRRFSVACLLAAIAFAGAPVAGADPADLVPYCSGDQTPMDSNCRPTPSQVFTHGGGVGANPDTPLGLTPDQEPAV